MTKTENKEQLQGGHFGNGFLLGIIVGGLIVFFFGTKKGREIFKLLTEQGQELLQEVLEDNEQGEPSKSQHKDIEEETAPIKILHVHQGHVDAMSDEVALREDEERKKPVKFKGIPKKR